MRQGKRRARPGAVAALSGVVLWSGGLAASARNSELVISMQGDSPCAAVFLDISENGRALGTFNVMSSGMVKRGPDYASLPALVTGRTYEFNASCVATTKFTQSLSLKFKADGRPVNLIFLTSGFSLKPGR